MTDPTGASEGPGSQGRDEPPAGTGTPGGEGTGPGGQAAAERSLASRLRAVYAKQVGPSEQALLQSWSGFTATFATARGVTHVLRRQSSRGGSGGGSGGIVVGGRHLHHYNLGILLLVGVGGIAVHGEEHRRRHPMTALAYGGGAALVVDELALLLDLNDVYWAQDGRYSVDTAVGLIAVGGLLLAAVPFWHGAAREVLRTRPRGPGPQAGSPLPSSGAARGAAPSG